MEQPEPHGEDQAARLPGLRPQHTPLQQRGLDSLREAGEETQQLLRKMPLCAICYILDTTILILSLLPLVVFIYLAVCFTLTCAFAYELCQMRYAKKKAMKWAYRLRKSQLRQSLNSRRNWCKLRTF